MLKTVGFLACDTTLPGEGNRREDAYEHDLMIEALAPAFAAAGLQLRVIDWEAPIGEFTNIELVLLGTAWNYQDKSGAFLAKLEALALRGITVCNPPEVVRWNITKTYLRELKQRGARTIPTLWLDAANHKEATEAMDQFGSDRLVVKRQIGAGADGQQLLEKGKVPADWRFDAPVMLQPFLPAIAEQGELSFVFIDGAFSHALRKCSAKGEYRIQSLYGGTELDHNPSPKEASSAKAIMDLIPFKKPLYARIDMLAQPDDELALMEAELIEPYLYPVQGRQLGERLAIAIATRLDHA